MRYPHGLAVSPINGDIYIADQGNNRIRVISLQSGMIATYAGSGSRDNEEYYDGRRMPAKEVNLNSPHAIAISPQNGDLYIADWSEHRILMISAKSRMISSVAGNGKAGYRGDGGLAKNAQLSAPFAVHITKTGDIYIADSDNHRIRVISASNKRIATIAGSGKADFSGDGGYATEAALDWPNGVYVATNGDVYIADTNNNRIRTVSAKNGSISTVAGNGEDEYNGDELPSTRAALGAPTGLVVKSNGDMYIVDPENGRIRFVPSSSSASHSTDQEI